MFKGAFKFLQRQDLGCNEDSNLYAVDVDYNMYSLCECSRDGFDLLQTDNPQLEEGAAEVIQFVFEPFFLIISGKVQAQIGFSTYQCD